MWAPHFEAMLRSLRTRRTFPTSIDRLKGGGSRGDGGRMVRTHPRGTFQ